MKFKGSPVSQRLLIPFLACLLFSGLGDQCRATTTEGFPLPPDRDSQSQPDPPSETVSYDVSEMFRNVGVVRDHQDCKHPKRDAFSVNWEHPGILGWW